MATVGLMAARLEAFTAWLPILMYPMGTWIALWKISHENRIRKYPTGLRRIVESLEGFVLKGFPEPYAWYYLYQAAQKPDGPTFYLTVEGKETILQGSITEWPVHPDDSYTILHEDVKELTVPRARVISIETILPQAQKGISHDQAFPTRTPKAGADTLDKANPPSGTFAGVDGKPACPPPTIQPQRAQAHEVGPQKEA